MCNKFVCFFEQQQQHWFQHIIISSCQVLALGQDPHRNWNLQKSVLGVKAGDNQSSWRSAR